MTHTHTHTTPLRPERVCADAAILGEPAGRKNIWTAAAFTKHISNCGKIHTTHTQCTLCLNCVLMPHRSFLIG